MLTKEDLKAIEKLLFPRFDKLEKRMDALEERMDALEEKLDKFYGEFDRRISSIVDVIAEMRDGLENLALVSLTNRGDSKRQDGDIQEIYKMNTDVNDRLDAIERHLDTKYDPLSRSLMDKSKMEYERKRLKV